MLMLVIMLGNITLTRLKGSGWSCILGVKENSYRYSVMTAVEELLVYIIKLSVLLNMHSLVWKHTMFASTSVRALGQLVF